MKQFNFLNEGLPWIKRLKLWKLITLGLLLLSHQVSGCKWVYRIKYLLDGTIERCKACLVAMEFTKKLGLDYSETFCLVAKSVSVRIVLSLATVKGQFLH